jgi:hypothetical protein
MNQDVEKLRALLADNSTAIDPQWLEQMKQRYPFFSLAECLQMRNNPNQFSQREREALVAKMTLTVSDSEALQRLVEEDGDRFDNFYPPTSTKAASTTNQAIDKFLETYGSNDTTENEVLERLIFNPVADYSQQLARQEEQSLPDATPSGNSQDDRINRFILSVRGKEEPTTASDGNAIEPQLPIEQPQHKPETSTVTAPAPPTNNSLLSESLAKIYIKTHRYERAYEILEHLSLAFPEKNAYFADQLRFLRKLMFAEQQRKHREA